MKKIIDNELDKVSTHVHTRCVNWSNLMTNSYQKEIFINALLDTCNERLFELNAFVLLNNHVHLLITTENDKELLAEIIQRIKLKCSCRYNKLEKRIGPFWNERFGRKYIEHSNDPEHYLLHLLWYFAYNPVRKNLSEKPEEYEYSSIKHYIYANYKDYMPIVQHPIYLKLDSEPQLRIEKFIKFRNNYENEFK